MNVKRLAALYGLISTRIMVTIKVVHFMFWQKGWCIKTEDFNRKTNLPESPRPMGVRGATKHDG